MKKLLFISAIFLFSAAQCALFNQLGLTSGHIKGDKAKGVIMDKVMPSILNDLMLSASDPANALTLQTNAILNSMSAEFANIDDNQYYRTKDVDNCAEIISNGGMFGLLTNTNFAPWLNAIVYCDLKPDNSIWDP